MAGTNAILLAGAPDVDSLQWEDAALTRSFDSPVRRFLNGEESRPTAQTQASMLTQLPLQWTKWRAVPMSDPTLDAKVSMPKDVPPTQFLSFSHRDAEDESQERTLFLKHSLALLNNLDCSQIAAPASFPSTYPYSTVTPTTSFGTDNGSFSFAATSPIKLSPARQDLNIRGDITDLKRVPPADHITRILPQTITINLLAAVICVSPTRTVRLRKRDGEMDIIELLIGDETRSGFGVSFWLPPLDSYPTVLKEADGMRSSLQQLRAGDVVLVQNVALSAFRGCVYGQSLNRRFARNSTSVTVLKEAEGLSTGAALRGKFEQVQRWRDDFVGRSNKTTFESTGKRTEGPGEDDLPPDTQSPTKYR